GDRNAVGSEATARVGFDALALDSAGGGFSDSLMGGPGGDVIRPGGGRCSELARPEGQECEAGCLQCAGPQGALLHCGPDSRCPRIPRCEPNKLVDDCFCVNDGDCDAGLACTKIVRCVACNTACSVVGEHCCN